MALVFGIGSGLFACCFLWLLGLAACLYLARTGKQGGAFGIVFLLLIITLGMIFYPRKTKDDPEEPPQPKNVDTLAIPRYVYTTFLALFVLVAMVAFLFDHVIMQNTAPASKAKKTYTF